MEDIITFTGVVMIVFGILQIILFFKIWGMTNNVSKIKGKLEENLNDDAIWFFVKFGGKFFSAHLANSVSAYIFL